MSHPKPRPLTKEELEDLPRQLAEIPRLYDELPTIDEHTQQTDSTGNDAGHTDRKPGSKAPLNLNVLHLTDTRYKPHGWRTHNPGRIATIHRLGTLPALIWWVQLVEALAQDKGVTTPEHPAGNATVETECAWLTETLQLVLAQPGRDMFVRDIARLHAELDRAAAGTYEFQPRCGTCSRILHPADDGTYSCRVCRRIYTPKTMIDLGRRHPPMPARDIAKTLNIAPATIRSWEHRGLITSVKRNHQGRKLYALADAMRLKERLREPRNRSSKKEHNHG